MTLVVPETVMPWLEIAEALAPEIGSGVGLKAVPETSATPRAVNDGGPWVAA